MKPSKFLGKNATSKKDGFLSVKIEAPRKLAAPPVLLTRAERLLAPLPTVQHHPADWHLEMLALGVMLANSYESPAPPSADWISI